MNSNTLIRHTDLIKLKAKEHGFSYCGISKAEKLDEEAKQLEKWLNQNRHGKMQYMENYFDKRIDPTLLMPGAKSIISFMYNYYTTDKQKDISAPKIAKYAFGEDYHFVIKEKLATILSEIQTEIGSFEARVFVDSAPILEKAWAKKSGIGWQGKNTNIINPKSGSFFFLAELIVDLPLIYDGPIKNYCGSCNACVEACPTDALQDPNFIDGSKCISYYTIELKDALLPNELKDKFKNWVFGCDICQDVCPWNRFSQPHTENKFKAKREMLDLEHKDWEDITADIFKILFKNSAIKRTKFNGLKRNINFLH